MSHDLSTTSLEYLGAELERIGALLRQRASSALDDVEPGTLDESVSLAEAATAARAEVAPTEESRLGRLVRAFRLSPLETDALLVSLAPELDTRCAALIGALRGDAAKARPSVDLLLWLLVGSGIDRLGAWPALVGGGLVRERLVRLVRSAGDDGPFLGDEVIVEPRIVAFLLGSDDVAPGIAADTTWLDAGPALDALFLTEETRASLERLALVPGAPCAFEGPAGVGKRSAARWVAEAWGKRLLVVSAARFEQAAAADVANRLALAAREAVLRDAVLYIDELELLQDEPKHEQFAALWSVLAGTRAPFAVGSTRAVEPPGAWRGMSFGRVTFEALSARSRAALWRAALARDEYDELCIEGLASQFCFNATQLRDAAYSARRRALARGAGPISASDLAWACRQHAHGAISRLATQVEPRYEWSDIVLPPDGRAQLLELCARAKHRGRVFEEWGFDRKLARGKGLSALFSGPSGTGKTMAAEVIAHDLGCDLYKVDLALVVSKYIGETEKNLARVFEEAEQSHCILFFDEADALFGKRSEVKDAHDRYANIEVAYLLQRMEAFSGTSILATNSRKSLDAAFTRRLAFCIHFALPDAALRRRIWESVWPAEVPRAGSLDLAGVSERFELSGGNIKNVAIAAAFAAASNGQVVTTQHLVHAVRREYQKLGKLCVPAEFGPYFELLGAHA